MQKRANRKNVEFLSLLTRVKRHPGNKSPRQECDPLVNIWLLRLAIHRVTNQRPDDRRRRDTDFFMDLINHDDPSDPIMDTPIVDLINHDPADPTTDTPGMDRIARDSADELPPKEVIAKLEEAIEKKEPELANVEGDALSLNVSRLGETLGLSDVEQALLFFLVRGKSDGLLHESLSDYTVANFKQVVSLLACILNISLQNVKKALGSNAPLVRTGIVKINQGHSFRTDLTDVLEIDDGFVNRMLGEYETNKEFQESLLQRSALPRLSGEDFSHVRRDYQSTLKYLKESSAENQTGVNILIYGKPGVGKTEMARSLCAESGLQLYEVSSKDQEGNALKKAERISSCMLTDRLLAGNADSVLLFDEIEDVFPSKILVSFPFTDASNPGKAWTNHLLEHNSTPIIWVTNSVEQIDPAIIRRFDIVLHLRQPNPATRRRMLNEMLAGLQASEAWRNRMAGCRNLAPAHIERAAKVASIMLKEKEAAEGVTSVMLKEKEVTDGVTSAVLKEKEAAEGVTSAVLKEKEAAEGVTSAVLKEKEAAEGVTSAVLKEKEATEGVTSAMLKEKEAAEGVTSAVLKEKEATEGVTSAMLKEKEAAEGVTSVMLKEKEAAEGATSVMLKEKEAAEGVTSVMLKEKEAAEGVTSVMLKEKEAAEGVTESTLETLLKNTLEAQGESLMPDSPASSMTVYDPTLLNVDADLQALSDGLQKQHRGRLCFYGPPGTGKTAFAHHLAESVDKPLLVKRLDEVLSMWVGGTERHIAAMFREAEAEDATLLLDEADSLLRDRRGAVQSWEANQVNQMLTCMEHFDGIFIASTNLMDDLDEASLRRFDCKIAFNALNPDQAWRMFLSALAQNNLTLTRQETESLNKRLLRLHNLTPGDYDTVLRKQCLFNVTPNPLQLLEALEKECAAKPDSQRPIGFAP